MRAFGRVGDGPHARIISNPLKVDT